MTELEEAKAEIERLRVALGYKVVNAPSTFQVDVHGRVVLVADADTLDTLALALRTMREVG